MKKKAIAQQRARAVPLEPRASNSITLIFSESASKENDTKFPIKRSLTDSGKVVTYNYRTYFDKVAAAKAKHTMNSIGFCDKYDDARIVARVNKIIEP